MYCTHVKSSKLQLCRTCRTSLRGIPFAGHSVSGEAVLTSRSIDRCRHSTRHRSRLRLRYAPFRSPNSLRLVRCAWVGQGFFPNFRKFCRNAKSSLIFQKKYLKYFICAHFFKFVLIV